MLCGERLVGPAPRHQDTRHPTADASRAALDRGIKPTSSYPTTDSCAATPTAATPTAAAPRLATTFLIVGTLLTYRDRWSPTDHLSAQPLRDS